VEGDAVEERPWKRERGRGFSRARIPAVANLSKGKTLGIYGHVFQCHNEVASNGQFLKTVEALEEYISKTLDYAKDLKSLCKSYEISTIDVPLDMTIEDQKSETKKLVWKTKVQTYMKRVKTRESNLQSIFATIWGQCSSKMKTKLDESMDDYDEKSCDCDCVPSY